MARWMRPPAQARDVPLLAAAGDGGPLGGRGWDEEGGWASASPSAPPPAESGEASPSAPPPATIFTQEEFQKFLSSLKAGSGQLPSAAQLRQFRAGTADRLLWVAQMRQLAAAADGGAHLSQEAYERGLLADPQSLTAADGPWVQAMWLPLTAVGNSQAAQAFLSPIVVTHHSGRMVTISVDFAFTNVAQVMQLAGGHFGEDFDPKRHAAFAVGASQGSTLGVGCFVKITGLIQSEVLNGMVGQILKADGDEYEVAVPAGIQRLRQENVVSHNVSVVARGRGLPADLGASLEQLGASRLLWLEPGTAELPRGSFGMLRAIKSQFLAMDVDGDNRISAGELRNFLWNLHLSDADFATVKQRFAPSETRGGQNYIDVADMLFLLGRPHILSPGVPVDALIYEAVVSILGRRTTAHIDKDLSQEDRGVGYRHACSQRCPGYTISLMLQGTVIGCLAVCLLGGLAGLDSESSTYVALAALGAYLAYLLHLCCCVRLTTAFYNRTEGLEQVMEIMDRPRHEDPLYTWHVQCYHYETRTRTETERDSDGQTRTVTKTQRVRVDTHTAHASGRVPSTDCTPPFVPQTAAQQTQIDTGLSLDFSRSNYCGMFQRWCALHRCDLHQDCSRVETLPSRASSCLAVWVPGSQPCWMNDCCYWLCNLFLLSFCYRLFMQARLGHQDYTYAKICHDV